MKAKNSTPSRPWTHELHEVVEARYLHDYVIWLRFEDGAAGDIDLAGELYGPVFEPLKDIEYFKRVVLNPEIGTVTWPNGADFAPEYLYEMVRSNTATR